MHQILVIVRRSLRRGYFSRKAYTWEKEDFIYLSGEQVLCFSQFSNGIKRANWSHVIKLYFRLLYTPQIYHQKMNLQNCHQIMCS